MHDLSHLCNYRKPGGLKDGNAVLLGHNLWGVLFLPCGKSRNRLSDFNFYVW